MAVETNEVIVHKWVDAWLKGELTLLDDIFAPDYTVNGILMGVESVKQIVQHFHSALSGMTLELNEMVSDGDKVVVRWTVRGVQSGEFMGVPPTGKPIELTGINIYQIVAGRIVANHEQTNVLEVLRQLKVNQS